MGSGGGFGAGLGASRSNRPVSCETGGRDLTGLWREDALGSALRGPSTTGGGGDDRNLRLGGCHPFAAVSSTSAWAAGAGAGGGALSRTACSSEIETLMSTPAPAHLLLRGPGPSSADDPTASPTSTRPSTEPPTQMGGMHRLPSTPQPSAPPFSSPSLLQQQQSSSPSLLNTIQREVRALKVGKRCRDGFERA